MDNKKGESTPTRLFCWWKRLLGASVCLVQALAWCKRLLGASPCLVQALAWCKPKIKIRVEVRQK